MQKGRLIRRRKREKKFNDVMRNSLFFVFGGVILVCAYLIGRLVWLNNVNGDEYARKVLGFPEDYFMPCFIGIGKPRKDAVPVKQKEISIKERIHWDKFC